MKSFDEVVNLCARRGLVFPTSELYGPVSGFFEYAYYGIELKRRLEQLWWKRFVQDRDDVVGLDGALLLPERVFKASGHLQYFTDPLVECRKCKSRFRVDELVSEELKLDVEGLSEEKLSELLRKHKLSCLKCKGELSEARNFNLMFESKAGPAEESLKVFLRPETAQNIFLAFKQITSFSRKKLPFGVAQVGRAFRNEISPRNFLFRTREFTQMELEYFVHPKKKNDFSLTEEQLSVELLVLTAVEQEKKHAGKKLSVKELVSGKIVKSKVMAYWIAEFALFFKDLGLRNLRLRQHTQIELSHYSKETFDFEFEYPGMGWRELMGIADRGDFDLASHSKESKKDLSVMDLASGERVLPHVIEPSLGLDRLFFALLTEAFDERTEGGEKKNLLRLNALVAPVQVGVFPLMKKDGLAEKARGVFDLLKKDFVCEYDDAGSIGKRYARMDEIGCPFCITIDYDSLENNDVTLRDRDSTVQRRVNVSELSGELRSLFAGKIGE
ncbi:MAG: glycine--tRNA ligase [Candidatus Micrarchaeota archaeon]